MAAPLPCKARRRRLMLSVRRDPLLSIGMDDFLTLAARGRTTPRAVIRRVNGVAGRCVWHSGHLGLEMKAER